MLSFAIQNSRDLIGNEILNEEHFVSRKIDLQFLIIVNYNKEDRFANMLNFAIKTNFKVFTEPNLD